jgi:hypothetical protein
MPPVRTFIDLFILLLLYFIIYLFDLLIYVSPHSYGGGEQRACGDQRRGQGRNGHQDPLQPAMLQRLLHPHPHHGTPPSPKNMRACGVRVSCCVVCARSLTRHAQHTTSRVRTILPRLFASKPLCRRSVTSRSAPSSSPSGGTRLSGPASLAFSGLLTFFRVARRSDFKCSLADDRTECEIDVKGATHAHAHAHAPPHTHRERERNIASARRSNTNRSMSCCVLVCVVVFCVLRFFLLRVSCVVQPTGWYYDQVNVSLTSYYSANVKSSAGNYEYSVLATPPIVPQSIWAQVPHTHATRHTRHDTTRHPRHDKS